MHWVGLHALVDFDDVPAVGAEACGHVLGEGEVRGALDGDVVVVVHDDELAETKMAGQGCGFGGDALHQVAVGDDDVGVMVDDGVAGAVVVTGEPLLSDGEADGVGKALAEGAGRDLDTGSEAALRVAGSDAAPLAQALDLVEGEVVAGEVEQAVQEHGCVAGGEDKAVAVVPARVRGIVLKETVPEGVGHGGLTHGATGVTVARLLHGVGGQQAQSVDAEGVQVAVRHETLLMRPAARGLWRGGRSGPLVELAAQADCIGVRMPFFSMLTRLAVDC